MIADECFDHNVTIFVQDLRNNLAHGSVVIPKWNISYTYERQEFIGSMMYSKHELLGFGDWKEESFKYVSDVADRMINLVDVVGEHYNLLNVFSQKIRDLFARNASGPERDFFEIEDSHKRTLRAQWATILISQIGKDKDPYEYLHHYFDPGTVREILRLPRHSKKQVDFILSLKAAELECHDDLRDLLYEYFGVENDSSS